MKKQITINNISHTIETKDFIEYPSLGKLIKELKLPNDAETYKAVIKAAGDELNEERALYWMNVIDESEDTQQTIITYLRKTNKLYGVNRKVGIQLGYITRWAQERGYLADREAVIEDGYKQILSNPNCVSEIVSKSGYTASTFYQYVNKTITAPDKIVIQALKDLMGLSKRKLMEIVSGLEDRVAKLEDALLKLNK